MQGFEARQSYNAPRLVEYGKLAALTGAIHCTGLGLNKTGTELDDTNQTQSIVIGEDVSCAQG